MIKGQFQIEYWDWLVHRLRGFERYRSLFRQFHEKEFVWFVPNDDNRVVDGEELRYWFTLESRWTKADFQELPFVSVLEVLCALVHRATMFSFTSGMSEGEIMHLFLCNLGLDGYYGRLSQSRAEQVDEILDTFIWRRYHHDGSGGGLFPLRRPKGDQRKVEIWFQMNYYATEQRGVI